MSSQSLLNVYCFNHIHSSGPFQTTVKAKFYWSFVRKTIVDDRPETVVFMVDEFYFDFEIHWFLSKSVDLITHKYSSFRPVIKYGLATNGVV